MHSGPRTDQSSLIERLGLGFGDPAREDAFVDSYVRGSATLAQIFTLLGGIFFYIFFLWDRIIDPAQGEITHAIRGFICAPIMIALAGVLLTRFGKRHLELIVVFGYGVSQLGLVAIYALLARGYDYAAVGMIILYMGVTAAMPIRTRYLVVVSLIALVTTIAGHELAQNAQPGWLFINVLAMVNAIFFGLIASYLRERAARRQFATDQAIDTSRARIDDLLNSILPRDIAQRIQAGESGIADSLGEVSIIFIDMVGFTKHARNADPKQLTGVLDSLFSAFDTEAAHYGIDKIKTIGDAYMAIGGLERGAASRDHAENAAAFALSVQRVVKEMAPRLAWPIEVRIGLHVGPVVAGVIGVHRPAFDCWGEAVNLAARLERKAPPGRVLISESAYWRLRRKFSVDPHEALELKGIGTTACYLLGERINETTMLRLNAPLPTLTARLPIAERPPVPVNAGTTVLAGFADPATPGLGIVDRSLARLGLLFAEPVDEEAFTDSFVRSKVGISQIFIVASAISFAGFFQWDEIVDASHAHTALLIRLLFVLPSFFVLAALLYLPLVRRNLEWAVIAGQCVMMGAQVWIYTLLAHGFDYVVMGLVLMLIALSTSFSLRTKFFGLAMAISLAMVLGGHFIANNARPGWLIVNLMAIGSAMTFSFLATTFRERAARVLFMSDRALAVSRARADDLLGSILPADTVRRIQSGESAIADALESVSIVFADLAGFTALSRQLSPPDLIALLNNLFSRFDALASQHKLERIKTIGDAYIAVGGMGVDADPDHAGNAARFALAIREAARALMRETDYPINIRIGVHTGPVIAGVIGIRRPSFDCWGDTVVFASGLESQARPGSILVSDSVAARLSGRFSVESVSGVDVGDGPPAHAWELISANENTARAA